jgi:FkbM family methyltransferase
MQLVDTLKFITGHPLNRGRKLQSVLRFAKWQIGSRLLPGQIVYEWINGSRVIVRRGEAGLTGNLYCGLHELQEMSFVLHVVTSEDLFVDAGANVGSYTVLACAARGARGYCMEPVPSTYARLLDNVRINDLAGRVTALNIGLADKEGELVFTAGGDTVNHVVAEGESTADVVRVKVRPLDSVLAGESPNVLKIDVEGFETPVIAGAAAVLGNESLHSVIMELNGSGSRYGHDEAELVKKMFGYGFRPFSYDPFRRELLAASGLGNQTGNTLFVRNERLVKERIAAAPRVCAAGVWL